MHKILAFFLLCFAACSIDSSTVPDVGMMLASDGATSAPRDGGVGGRISVPQYRVDGVSLTQLTFYDRTLDTYCFPRKTTAGLRCVPSGVLLLNYADAGCTQLAGTSATCQSVSYGIVADALINACDQGNYRTFRLRKLTQANYYGKSGATCVALPLPANTALYAADTEIDPTTFAEAVEVR